MVKKSINLPVVSDPSMSNSDRIWRNILV